MQIAIFHNIPPSGALRTLQGFASGLAQRGHTLDLYSLRVPDREFYPLEPIMRETKVRPFSVVPLFNLSLNDVVQVRINFYDRPTTLWRVKGLHRQLAEEINTKGYDVAVAFACINTYAPYLLRYLQVPAVYYCTEPPRSIYESIPSRPESWRSRSNVARFRSSLADIYYAGYLRRLKQIDVQNTRAADLVLVSSYYAREAAYRAYGLESCVSYPGVDTNVFRPTAGPEGSFVVSVGTLHPLKAHDFVIESLGLVDATIRPSLKIVSHMIDETERDYLVGLAQERGVELNLHHNLSNEELARMYSAALVTACSAIMEPFGLTPLESMACGTPVVAVKEAGFRETIIDGESGYLVDRDPEQFAEAVSLLLIDRALRAELGQRARRIAERWEWQGAIDTFERYLLSISPKNANKRWCS